MNKALGDALKAKMLEMHQAKHPMLQGEHPANHVGSEGAIATGHSGLKGEGDESGDPSKNGSDLAPEINDEAHGGDALGAGDQLEHQDHMQILAALSDHGHGGREAGGLQERVADKAKEKIASIQKHKQLGKA